MTFYGRTYKIKKYQYRRVGALLIEQPWYMVYKPASKGRQGQNIFGNYIYTGVPGYSTLKEALEAMNQHRKEVSK